MIDTLDAEYTMPGELDRNVEAWPERAVKRVEAWPEKADRRIKALESRVRFLEMTVHRLINAADQVQIDGVQRSIDGNS